MACIKNIKIISIFIGIFVTLLWIFMPCTNAKVDAEIDLSTYEGLSFENDSFEVTNDYAYFVIRGEKHSAIDFDVLSEEELNLTLADDVRNKVYEVFSVNNQINHIAYSYPEGVKLKASRIYIFNQEGKSFKVENLNASIERRTLSIISLLKAAIYTTVLFLGCQERRFL